MPLTAKDKLLVHITIPPPPGWLDAVAARFPSLKVHWEVAKMIPGPDIESADALPAHVLEGVTMMCLYPPASAKSMRDVRFVQLASAGSDRWRTHPRFLDPNVAFCSGSGVHPPQIAEWVVATWLAHKHKLFTYAEQQKARLWEPRFETPVTEAIGRRMGILGYGAIGRQVARLAKAFNMEVYAYTQSPRTTPESKKHVGYSVPGTGDPDGLIPVKWFSGPPRTAITEFLSQDLDILVVCLPLHETTRGILGAEQFQLMGKSKTFVSNIGRGPLIDHDALVDALQNGTISGAALDVADPEPLPKDHPLWDAPNLFISPHVSWSSTETMPRVADLLMRNLERLDKGEPLLNLVQKP